MKDFICIAILGLIVFSCNQIKPDNVGVVAYFDVDSLINSQVKQLSQGSYTLKKTVLMEDSSETQNFSPDSAGWKKEFNFLDQLNINQPRLFGAYDSTKNNSAIRYTPKFNNELPVRYLAIEKKNGSLSSVSGKLVEKNDIYETSMEATLKFEDNLLQSYQINGYQKLILKDSVFYEIRGTITK